MAHNWQPNPGADPIQEHDLGLSTSKCTKCGCIRIQHIGSIMDNVRNPAEYKPAQWTWNPFKTLKKEPRCPARW